MSDMIANRIEPSLTRRAGWMSDLVSGLQNRLERFDSATGLEEPPDQKGGSCCLKNGMLTAER